MSQARLAWDKAPQWAKNAKKDSPRSSIFFLFSSSAEPGPRLSEASVAFCVKRGEEKNNASHSFRAKCRVRLAWLIKRLLRRLWMTTHA